MQVTNVRIRLINTEGRLKAVGSITLNDSFVVHDVRVLEGERGMFVAMPSKQMPNGMFRDVAHPINTETRSLIDSKVLEAYEDSLKEAEVETVEEEE
ncbi:MAG TPA: septation regulator SpoVG [Acholeplasma sp.]|nr:septation regulator SpoVG [Acholeplasma sp.]